MLKLKGLLLLFAFSINVYSSECQEEQSGDIGHDISMVELTGLGAVTAWGVANWDYFSRTPHAKSEGWFSADTDEGGADKAGHFYLTYALSQGLSAYFKHQCFDADNAHFYGALSSLVIMGYMELGDSFSSYGFSYEDLVSNTLGGMASYYFYKYPELSKKFDIRWEYGLHPNKVDVFTDYQNSKYLLAVKLNGFEATRKGFLKHLELHLGYYSRGYRDNTTTNERNLYFGLGLNLTDLFRQRGYRKTATLLKYYQPPNSYIDFKNNLNN